MDLDQFIDRAQHLPPAPTLLPELLDLLTQPDIDSERVIRLVTYDPALTTNVLRLSNSAALGSSVAVSSLPEAVFRLGFEQILRLVLASCGSQSLRWQGVKEEAIQRQLWSHSVVSAIGGQTIAKDRGLDHNLTFTAALLHDLGKMIMWDVLGEKYTHLLDEARQNRSSLIDSEQRVFGLQHAELGGRLLARWKLPVSLVAGVCFHYNPAAATPYQNIAACVYLGNFIADQMGYPCNPATCDRSHAEVFRMLELEPGGENRYIDAIQEGFALVQSLINL
jgi:HD-like signal output (HDOD) protein